MDLPMCLMLVAILLPAVCAVSVDQGPQKFTEENKATPAPKVQKREPKYEMKEIILYLTPSQIRAFESGQGLPKGLIDPQIKSQTQLQTTPKPDLSANRQANEQIQNMLNNQGQKIGKEIKKLEAMKQQRMQLQESNRNKAKNKDLQNIAPENNAPTSPQLDLQKREKYFDLPLQLELIPPSKLPQTEQSAEITPSSQFVEQTLQTHVPNLEQLIKAGDNDYYRLPQAYPTASPNPYANVELQRENYPAQQEKSQKPPQNYAYLYYYPRGKPADFEKYQLFYPDSQEQKPKQSQQQEQKPKETASQQERRPSTYYLPVEEKPQEPQPQKQPTTFYLPADQKPQEPALQKEEIPKTYYLPAEHKPKEFIIQPEHFTKERFLHQIPKSLYLQPELSNKEFFFQADQIPKELLLQSEHNPKELILQPQHNIRELLSQPELHSLFNVRPNFQLIPYEYALQNKLEAQQILQAQLNEHEFNSHRLQAHKLEAHQLEDIDTQQLLLQKVLEPQYPQQDTVKLETQDPEKDFKTKQEPEGAVQPLKEDDIKNFHPAHQEKLKEVMEAQKQLAKLEKEDQEARRLDDELEKEQKKAEKFKEEQYKEQQESQKEQIDYPYSLDYLMNLEPKRTQMHSILKPLFQGHNIAESLQQQKENFPHHRIHLEKGFRPLQYAPKYNDEYGREVEKLLRRNRLEKQKALEKAAAIANEPPEIIKTDGNTFEIIKHVTVPIPTPVMVPVPQPFEVKVPQPYPVPLEIYRPVPIPIVKTEKVEVEKPVPIEIEKRVPFPVTKNVYVKIDKPYIVEKVVPVEIKKEIPVEIAVRSKQKFSIIKHVWES